MFPLGNCEADNNECAVDNLKTIFLTFYSSIQNMPFDFGFSSLF